MLHFVQHDINIKTTMKTTANILLFCFISFIANAQYSVTTYAGNGSAGFTNGNAGSAKFNGPYGICMDKSENLFIADGGNNCIRKITPAGVVSTYAGTGVAGYLDGTSSTAKFNSPFDLCADDSGNVYVSDFSNHRIRKISVNGTVSTIAGSGTAGYMDGTAGVARFDFPRGICIDKQGNLYIGDSWNHRIRKIDNMGNVTTYAGGGSSMGVSSPGSYVDANDTSARFHTPTGLSIDKSGNIYVADAYNHRIRKINTSRVVTTYCGSGPTGVSNGGYADGSSSAAVFNTPTEVFSDSSGNLLIGDTFGNKVRKVDVSGNATTIAGKDSSGFTNGAGNVAKFNYARGITSNFAGDKIYVVDFNNHAIRLITGLWNGVGELKWNPERKIEIYPNPASDHVTVLLKDFKDKTFKIFDLQGREVTKNVFTEGIKNENNQIQIKLNLEKLAKGVYVIQFNDSNLSGRIIRE